MCEPSTVLVDVADLEVCDDEEINMEDFLMTHSAAGPTTLKPGRQTDKLTKTFC